MKKLFNFLLSAVFLCSLFIATNVFAVATPNVTLINDTVQRGPYWSKQVRIITYQIDGIGELEAVSTAIDRVTGILIGFKFDTTSAGDPDDLWDITLTDTSGADILQGAGTDMPELDTDIDARRIPVELINSLPIFIFNESIILHVTHFSVAGSPTVLLSFYFLLP